MKARIILAILAAAIVALLVIQSRHSSRVLPDASSQIQTNENIPRTTSHDSFTQNSVGNRQIRTFAPGVEDDTNKWALTPIPAGRNTREYLEEIARKRGVSLEVLTQELAAIWSSALTQQLTGSVQFYGRIVDEKEIPLKGATAFITCLISPEKQFTTNVISDVDGSFAIENLAGQGLSVRIIKEGFEEIPGTNQTFFMYHGIANGFQPDPANPVFFRLRPKENAKRNEPPPRNPPVREQFE